MNRFDILCIQEYYKYRTNRRTAHEAITQHPVHREINLAHGNRKHADKVLAVVALLTRAASDLICSADTCDPEPQPPSEPTILVPRTCSNMEYCPVNMRTIQKRIHCVIPNLCTQSAHESNSNDKLDKLDRLTDVDRCRVLNKVNQYEMENQCSPTNREPERCELHNKDMDVKKSITRMRVEDDKYGSTGRAAYLKFKCVRNARECMETVGRIIGVRLQALAMLGLCLTMVASCAAAPASRTSRSVHHEKYAKGYLQNFGYMKRGRPEVGNLQMGGDEAAQYYEDDFRIAVKTLQEFGGIPVTGEIDGETIELMKQKRCGRPDREEDDERGHRKKRFAVQGAKWKHTNLTWSLSSVRPPSQLDPHGTREVLARALDVWEQASRLTFTEINSENADIVVSFAKRYHDDSYPFDGRGLILAHAFFPATGRGGDAHFDDDELWLLHPNNENDEGTSLFAVAAHEFGHSLGLSHSSVKGALMFPWYQGIKPNFVLPEDDRNGIQQMYGPKVNRTWAMIPHVYRPMEPPPTTTTTTTTTTTRRPFINHHHNRHSDRNPHRRTYAPYPRTPTKYPVYYPERPDRPTYYPDRRFYNNTDDYPRRTNPNHHYPRPTETTTHATTYRPRYPSGRSDYPPHPRPNYPTDPRQDYPRRPYYPEKTTVKPQPPSDIPDSCNTNYDAVALIRNELFIFKNRYHWRIGARGQYPGYPMEISRMWSGLPKNLTHVDAVYERPDRKIAIFVGKELYLFDTQYLVRGYPKPLTALGLPEGLTKLDAAMVWGYNGKTFFFSGNMYWKYDEDISKVELDYPRNMAMWKGVGYNIDSVFQWKDGKTYFFKGKGFWKFNDLYMRVEHEKQLLSASFWMGCSTGRREPYRAVPSAPGSTLRSFSAATSLTSTTIIPFISLIVLLLRSSTQFCL